MSKRNGDKKRKIFEENLVRGMIIDWRKSRDIATLQKIILECTELIEVIINTYKFHNHAPPEDLLHDCIIQLPDMLENYDPDRRCFTYLSVTIKHFLIKHTAKIRLRNRTQVPYSTLDGGRNNQNAKYLRVDRIPDTDALEAREEVMDTVDQLAVRFFDETAVEVLRYYMAALREDNFAVNKGRLTNTAMLMFDVSGKQAQFLYDYLQVKMRHLLLDYYVDHIRDLDLYAVPTSLSLVPEIVDTIGYQNTLKLIAVFGGSTLTLPSAEQVEKLRRDLDVYRGIERDGSRENVEAVSGRHGLSAEMGQATHRRVFKKLQAIPRREVPLAAEN